jgi:fusion and transport protein UGO1
MATSRDAPNPLRPYYIPPSIGLPPDLPQNASSSAAPSYSSRTPKPSFGSQARDILSDLDYDSYFADSSPTVAGHAKKLLDQALWNYTSVLLAQPFEVAKTLLQVHQAQAHAPPGLLINGDELKSRPNSFASGKFEDYPSDESDEDSPGYFTSTAPRSHSPTYERGGESSRSPERRRRHAASRSRDSTPTQAPVALRKLELRKANSLLEVIAQLWQKESAWGVWKGTNVTFVYNFLLKTTESWTRSLLSALLNIPDPGLIGTGASGIGGLDIIDSPSPFMSLSVAVAATAIAATLLAPLDLVRTRLIVTPTAAPPRTIYPSLSLLPSFSIPSGLLPVTLLHAIVPTFLSSSTPLFLRSTLSIDPIVTPSAYSFSTFLSSTAELFIRLPLETVLRRGQVAVLQDHENARLAAEYRHLPRDGRPLKSPAYGMENEDPAVRSFKTIIDPGPYRGVLGTMWYIVRDEGVQVLGPGAAKAMNEHAKGRAATFSTRTRIRKGQGVHGLWRGWRVGFWGLVGVWGAAAMGGGGGEF